MRVVAVGDACVDLYEDGRAYSSGNVIDTAVHLVRLGIPTTVISAVGTDSWGKNLIRDLDAAGVDTSGVRVLRGQTALTRMSIIGTERVHGEYEEGVLADVVFDEADCQVASSATLVHSALWGRAEEVLSAARAGGALVSFDFADRVDHPLVGTLAGVVSYGFFSFLEPSEAVDRFLRERVSEGMICAVATFGALGSRAFDGVRFYSAGIISADVVNTVGAGDSYIAGFVSEVLRGRGVQEAMQKGAEVAASVVGKFEPW